MSEENPPESSPVDGPVNTSTDPVDRRLFKGRIRIAARSFLFVCLAGVLAYVTYAAIQTINEDTVLVHTEAEAVANAGLGSNAKTLAAKFTDKDGRLLADPPATPDQLLNPTTLVVAHIGGVDETPGRSWLQWEARLARITGKKVVDQIYRNSATEIAADSGKVTLLALHSADAPFLVNNYGFQPLAVLGNGAGINGNHLDLVVPAGSSISTPADLKGHRLVCTVPSSITGYRAAIAMLMSEDALRPNVDYEIIWSLSQKNSIEGVAKKEYDCAAVSDDKLQSMVDKGTVATSQYKIIYQSPVIPRTTIGCFYNLNPALVDQLRQAILAPGDAPAATTTSTGPTTADDTLRFLPVDYKRDFGFVRTIDDQFDPRFDAQKPSREAD